MISIDNFVEPKQHPFGMLAGYTNASEKESTLAMALVQCVIGGGWMAVCYCRQHLLSCCSQPEPLHPPAAPLRVRLPLAWPAAGAGPAPLTHCPLPCILMVSLPSAHCIPTGEPPWRHTDTLP